jgi:hypothetical protein
MLDKGGGELRGTKSHQAMLVSAFRRGCCVSCTRSTIEDVAQL